MAFTILCWSPPLRSPINKQTYISNNRPRNTSKSPILLHPLRYQPASIRGSSHSPLNEWRLSKSFWSYLRRRLCSTILLRDALHTSVIGEDRPFRNSGFDLFVYCGWCGWLVWVKGDLNCYKSFWWVGWFIAMCIVCSRYSERDKGTWRYKCCWVECMGD